MNVFLSWSGPKSQAVAEEFNQWLQCVLQSVQPWISTTSIESGSLWFDEISNSLSESGTGIVFVTQENKNSPWILFEAGALAKGLKLSRVCTFLTDLTPQDINNPLMHFNHTFPNEESVYKLVLTLNSRLETNQLKPEVLKKVFEKYWPDLAKSLERIQKENPKIEPEQTRDREDKIDEILLATRSMSNRISRLESNSYSTTINMKDFPKDASLTHESYKKIINRKNNNLSEEEIKSLLIAAATALKISPKKNIDPSDDENYDDL